MKKEIIEAIDKKCIVITGEREGQSFEDRMLASADIKGALSMDIRVLDNRNEYVYDIKDMQNLSEHFKGGDVKKENIKKFLEDLNDVVLSLSPLLIPQNRIYLLPENVYVKDEEYIFLICPEYDKSLFEGLKEVLEFFLDKIDYADNESVLYAYKIYHKLVKDRLGLSSLVLAKEPEDAVKRVPVKENLPGPRVKEDKPKEAANMVSTSIGKREKKLLICGTLFILGLCIMYSINKILCIFAGTVGIIIFLSLIDSMKKKAKIEAYEATVLLGADSIRPMIMYEEKQKMKSRTLDNLPFIIGSSKEKAHLQLKNRRVSRTHLRIFNEGEYYYAEDMNSTNGTRIDGKKLKSYEVVPLKDKSEIILADTKVVFINPAAHVSD